MNKTIYSPLKEETLKALKRKISTSGNLEGDVDLYFAILREYYAVVTKHVVESDRENYAYLQSTK